MARRLPIVVVCAAAALALAQGASAACTHWASWRGSNSNPGTAAAPFRTVQHLADALPRGATGCLMPGSVFHERVWLTRAVTLRSSGGLATIVGNVTIARGASGVTVQGLKIEGSRGRATVDIRGDGAQILGNDISGSGFDDVNTPCVYLDGVHDVVIDGNRIHRCTYATRRDLYAPGILVASAVGTRITNNVISRTVGDGIALAPNAQRSVVEHNIVDGNVSALYIGGDTQTASSHNLIADNILSNSGRWNIYAAWSGLTGTKNVIVSNCIWNGFSGNVTGDGLVLGVNLTANPRFRSRAESYTMGRGPCLAMRPSIVAAPVPATRPTVVATHVPKKRPSVPKKRPSVVAAHVPVLPQFRVAYRLRALPTRVQFVLLTLTDVARGAGISFRCVSGCAASWHSIVHSSSVTVPVLRDAWLARGAVLEVRARRFGFAGSYARVVVTGLPHGVRVEHACLSPTGTIPVPCSRYS